MNHLVSIISSYEIGVSAIEEHSTHVKEVTANASLVVALVASKYVQEECATTILEERVSGRDWIVSTAMSQLSVESMQSLIIIAFHDVCRVPRSKHINRKLTVSD